MSTSDTDRFDPSRRRLCPDGACIGLLDEAGRCRECGRTASGKLEAQPDAAPAWSDEPQGGDDLAPMEALPGELEVDAGFDPKRKLCPDGACMGIIGPEGRCNVCGQAG